MAFFSRVLCAFVLVAPVSVASAQIMQPGTQPTGHPGGLVTLIQSSGPCHTCHANIDATDDYEPYESWRGSLMASAERDPVFRAALAIAEVDQPHAADFCVRCHSPEAWLRGRSELPDYDTATSTPRFNADDMVHPPTDDLDGVSCMVCHRSLDPGDANLFNARLVINDGASNGELRMGLYSYAAGENPGHPTAVSTFLPTSRLCGQCHDITSPLFMGHRAETSGVVATTRSFAIERTYSEWRDSVFPSRMRDCQDCHMPVVDHPVRVADFASFPATLRSDAARHDLLGAAAWQLDAIAATIPNGAPAAPQFLTANATRIRAFMQTSASVDIMASAFAGGAASATVRVTNHTGHKLPTGYPEGRRMWLEIDVLDDTGASVAGSARYDATTGMLQSDAQARTYEARMGVLGADGMTVTPGFHFVLADTLMLDTRIPPEGFAPAASSDMTPLGRDYADPAGGYRNYDDVHYSFSGLCGTGTLHLRARLRYQATTREYMEYLRDHAPASQDPALAGMSWGQVAFQAWRDHGGATPLEIANATVVLGAAPMACPMIDAGVDAGAIDAAPTDAGSMSADAARADAAAAPPAASPNCGCVATTTSRASAWALLAALASFVSRARRASRR